MDTRTAETYIFEGYGYPIEIKNVKETFIGGAWIPKIDYMQLARKEYLRLLNEENISEIQSQFLQYYEQITRGSTK